MSDKNKPWKTRQKRPRRLRKLLAELRSVRWEIEYVDLLAPPSLIVTDTEARLDDLVDEEERLLKEIVEFSTIPPTLVAFYTQANFLQTCEAVIPDLEIVNHELLAYLAKHPESLGALHWRKFEEVLELVLRDLGYQTELGPGQRDGGVDLRLIEKSPIGELVILVQAKRYHQTRKIGLEAVSALYGVLEAERANQAVLAATSEFEPSAKKFAEAMSKRIVLAGPNEIQSWIENALKRKQKC